MLLEVSWFFLRLIHSRFGMPLKASAGMLLMLLPAGQKSFYYQINEQFDTFR